MHMRKISLCNKTTLLHLKQIKLKSQNPASLHDPSHQLILPNTILNLCAELAVVILRVNQYLF